ncbi:type II toxin-antitoxin system RelE/ParE family toxin [Algoriphagus sp. AGSA1]|nr:type II toxin-antitoxin system RelE/ParE family toxin [Algoriphagus sp. AGSA1]
MNSTIFWTPLSLESFEECISFLEDNWGQIILEKFINLTEQKLKHLQNYPFLGEATEYPDIRRVLIHKNVSLFYMPEINRIKLLIFWDNRQNPENLFKKLASI